MLSDPIFCKIAPIAELYCLKIFEIIYSYSLLRGLQLLFFLICRTHGGVNVHDDDLTVTAKTIMWVKAIDMLMDKLRVAGADFTSIAAVSGTAQVGLNFNLLL